MRRRPVDALSLTLTPNPDPYPCLYPYRLPPTPLAPAIPPALPPPTPSPLPRCGAASWLPRVIGGPWGTWVAAVEDHQLRLEDTEQQMDLREQEDAANEVIKDANALSREEAKCDVCGKVASPTSNP